MQPVLAGFEDYLPLLIFFAVWWISSKKRKAMRREPSSIEDKEREGVTLQEILRQMLLGEEEAAEPMERRPHPLRPVPPVVPQPMERLDLEEEVEEPSAVGKQTAAVLPQTRRPAPVATERPMRPPSRETACHPARAKGLCRRDLRRAVVWSEILAPPVGMRDR